MRLTDKIALKIRIYDSKEKYERDYKKKFNRDKLSFTVMNENFFKYGQSFFKREDFYIAQFAFIYRKWNELIGIRYLVIFVPNRVPKTEKDILNFFIGELKLYKKLELRGNPSFWDLSYAMKKLKDIKLENYSMMLKLMALHIDTSIYTFIDAFSGYLWYMKKIRDVVAGETVPSMKDEDFEKILLTYSE